jgi:ABC-type phosphate transport system substrate-binding protein
VTLVTFNQTRPFPHNELQLSKLWRPSVFCRKLAHLSILLLMSASLASARDLALVSNKTNNFNTITLADLVKICKGESNHWPDGKAVTVIMRKPTSPEMRLVVEKIYGMSDREVTDLIATANHGRSTHPAVLIVATDEDVVNQVASLPGAVGIVDVYSINSSVSVVKLAGKLPLEPGYALHGN